MKIKPIRTEADYRAALEVTSALFDNPPKRGTPGGDRFEVLLTLMNAYESTHHAFGPPDPIDAIKFRMEQQGLTVQDMVPLIGAKNRVYEVLSQTRPLTLPMMKRIRAGLQISGDVLLGQQSRDGARPALAGVEMRGAKSTPASARSRAAAKPVAKPGAKAAKRQPPLT
jgi:HTH-type transcriptional regulator / antitoxin HigA